MNSEIALERLKNPADGGPADQLATLLLDTWLDQQVGALIPKELFKKTLRMIAEGWLQSPEALKGLTRIIELTVNDLQADRRALRELTNPELKATLREMLSRPYSPDKRLVLTVIDRPPVRELVRALLLQTVLDFGRKASAPVAGMAKSLGGFARMAASSAKSATGGLGALVGAVSGEVERQVEKRASEFVDSALAGVFGEIADAVSDPRRAAEAAELRLAFFEGVLELTLPALARELVNLDVPGGAQVLREGMQRWLESDHAETFYEGVADLLSRREGGRTLREVLEEAGQLQVYRSLGRELVRARVGEIVQTEAFSAWFAALHA